jgi:hypothetical protein
MPKTRYAVDYGPIWDAVVVELGNPLQDDVTMTETPSFDRTGEVYLKWFGDADFAPLGLHAEEFANVPAGPALTKTLPITVADAITTEEE